MYKILIVEDDSVFRKSIEDTLEQKGNYRVEIAENGKAAIDTIAIQDFDLILSDIRMPILNGLELFHWTKKNKPNIPVVLMTGFSEVLETQEASSLGVAGFLPKPFQQADLFTTIDEILKTKTELTGTADEPEAANEINEPEYHKISLEEFVAGSTIPYPIFLKISDNNFIKLAYQGEDLSADRIRTYKEKKILFLYLKKEDFLKYVGMNLTITHALNETKSISKEKKIKFFKHTGEVLAQKIFISGVDKAMFQESKEFIESTAKLLTNNDQAMNLLMLLNDHADHLYSHSLGVSLYAVMIAKQMDWHSGSTLVKVSLSGLYHDIGKKELSREIISKPRVQLTQKERALFETHPQRGTEILSQINGIPEDIAKIIGQHHETCTGHGYPLALTKNKIHPVARLIAVADVFCEYAIAGPQSKGLNAEDALTQMVQFNRDGLDPVFFAALAKVFNYKLYDRKVA